MQFTDPADQRAAPAFRMLLIFLRGGRSNYTCETGSGETPLVGCKYSYSGQVGPQSC